jgi:hypothetical protein
VKKRENTLISYSMAVMVNCRRDDLQRYTLYSATLSISRIGDSGELYLSHVEDEPEPLLPVANKLGRLLLPLHMPYGLLDRLSFNLGKPMLVLHDEVGRVHQLVMDTCIFMILMKEWAPPTLETQLLNLKGISEDRLLTSDGNAINNIPLLLPPNRPQELAQWQPFGDYEVGYDRKGRVFSVRQEGTEIFLASLWEQRF